MTGSRARRAAALLACLGGSLLCGRTSTASPEPAAADAAASPAPDASAHPGPPALAPAAASPPSPAPSSAAEPDDPVALLEALQARYDATRTLRIEFLQRYESRATGRSVEEAGMLLAAKPGRMRWEYRDPVKLFVLQGETAWFHVPDENVVYKMKAGATEARRIPSLFLAGRGSLARDFDAAFEPGSAGTRLRLVPRRAGEEYEYLLADVDPATYALRSLAVVDALGNRTEYVFRSEERDVSIPDRAFDFQAPSGAEIVETP